MKINKISIKVAYFFVAIMAFSITSCAEELAELNENPNAIEDLPYGLQLTEVQLDAPGGRYEMRRVALGWGLSSIQQLADVNIATSLLPGDKYIDFIDYSYALYDRYFIQECKEVVDLVSRTAEDPEAVNYNAMGRILKVMSFHKVTDMYGDIPYSEAGQGFLSNNWFPAYDRQQDIYIGILDELDEANTLLSSETGTISGDLIYGGDLSKWRKAVNALSLRILMSLSKKEGNSNVGVVSRFNAIVNNPSQYPIFTSNDDNTALPYYDLDGNEYPYFNSNQIKTNYYMDESFINHLKDREDPRLFAFAQREENGANLPEDDFNAYGGLPGSDLASANSARVSQGEGSLIAERYYNDPVNEPSIAIGYAEVQFILAEAAARGWTSGDASEHYQNGIRASMQFYNIDSAAIDTYLANPQIVYNASQGIEMIITQKYLSFFMNSGWEAFYNQRRTGFPEFSTDGPGILNNGIIPKRWMYPESEIQSNRENLEAAINSQYPNGDTVNGDMWLLKNE